MISPILKKGPRFAYFSRLPFVANEFLSEGKGAISSYYLVNDITSSIKKVLRMLVSLLYEMSLIPILYICLSEWTCSLANRTNE